MLAVDSAHRTVPFGALGMNSGVHEQVDLAWKLSATLAAYAGPTLLESYIRERRYILLQAHVHTMGMVAPFMHFEQAFAQAGPAIMDPNSPEHEQFHQILANFKIPQTAMDGVEFDRRLYYSP